MTEQTKPDPDRIWIEGRGWDSVTRLKKLKVRKRANKRASRAKAKAESGLTPEFLAQLDAALGPPIAREPFTREQQLHEVRLLQKWLAKPGKRQEQYRAQERLYRAVRLLVLRERRITAAGWGEGWEGWEGDIEPAAFAPLLAETLKEPVTRRQARHLLDQHAKLEGPDGPWPARVKPVT